MTMKRTAPLQPTLDLSRFSNCISHLQTSVAACEQAIEALGQAQTSLKPGLLERFLGLLEVDMAVCLDNQAALVKDLQEVIDSRIDQAKTQPTPAVGSVGGDAA